MTKKVTENKSVNDCPSVSDEEVNVMKIVLKDRVRRLLAISLPFPLLKTGNAAGSATVDAWVNILHLEFFYVDVFKAMETLSRECRPLEDYVINNHKGVQVQF